MLRRQEEQRQEDEGEREKAIAAGRKEGRLFFSAEKVGRGRACFPSREGRSGRKSEASRPPGLRLPCSFERARCDSQSPIHHGAVGDREEEEGRRHGRVFSLQWGICFSGGGGELSEGKIGWRQQRLTGESCGRSPRHRSLGPVSFHGKGRRRAAAAAKALPSVGG